MTPREREAWRQRGYSDGYASRKKIENAPPVYHDCYALGVRERERDAQDR